MKFTIKGLKTWTSREGGGYQFNLYRDGKKFAFVHQDGNGGPTEFQFADEEHPNSRGEFRVEFKQYCASLPYWTGHDGKPRPKDMDMAVAEMLDEHETQKQMARLRKKGILFRLSSDSPETIRTIGTLDLITAQKYLDQKHPGAYVLI